MKTIDPLHRSSKDENGWPWQCRCCCHDGVGFARTGGSTSDEHNCGCNCNSENYSANYNIALKG